MSVSEIKADGEITSFVKSGNVEITVKTENPNIYNCSRNIIFCFYEGCRLKDVKVIKTDIKAMSYTEATVKTIVKNENIKIFLWEDNMATNTEFIDLPFSQ